MLKPLRSLIVVECIWLVLAVFGWLSWRGTDCHSYKEAVDTSPQGAVLWVVSRSLKFVVILSAFTLFLVLVLRVFGVASWREFLPGGS